MTTEMMEKQIQNPCELNEDFLLINRYLEKKDNSAFQVLIERHIKWLKRLLYIIFNTCREDIEDTLQEIILNLLTEIKAFRFKSSFKTFFYRYAKNKAIDILRKKTRERRKILHYSQAKNMHLTDPLAEIIKKETKDELLKALFTLKQEQRVIIVMKELEGFTIKEIASIFGLLAGTVKSRLHRIRNHLAKILKKGGYINEK